MKRRDPRRSQDAGLFTVSGIAIGVVAVQAIQMGVIEGWGLIPVACILVWQATRQRRR